MKDLLATLSGIIYRHLNELYQGDGKTIPCKQRESCKASIMNEFSKYLTSKEGFVTLTESEVRNGRPAYMNFEDGKKKAEQLLDPLKEYIIAWGGDGNDKITSALAGYMVINSRPEGVQLPNTILSDEWIKIENIKPNTEEYTYWVYGKDPVFGLGVHKCRFENHKWIELEEDTENEIKEVTHIMEYHIPKPPIT